MTSIRLARNMMATRFELVLGGENESRLQALGEAALDEIASLERRLTFFHPNSELSLLNRRAFSQSVNVAPDILDLIQRAKTLYSATDGAFDPTIGPLTKCWTAEDDCLPSRVEIEYALARTGMSHVQIHPDLGTIKYTVDGLELDLGGIAKGYAIEKTMEFLKTAGVDNILLHGGTSTVATSGSSFDGTPWKIGISDQDNLLATIELNEKSLSVSAQSGKYRMIDGERYGHILDPGSGRPVNHTAVSAVVCTLATDCDALSTAALVLGREVENSQVFANNDCGVAVWQPAGAKSGAPELIFQHSMPAFSQNH